MIPIFDCYDTVAREGIDKLKSYFNTGDSLLHELYYKWIDTVFDTAIKLRTKHPYFLLDIIHEGNLRVSKISGKIKKDYESFLFCKVQFEMQ